MRKGCLNKGLLEIQTSINLIAGLRTNHMRWLILLTAAISRIENLEDNVAHHEHSVVKAKDSEFYMAAKARRNVNLMGRKITIDK